MAGICECGNEPSGSIKCEQFLDVMNANCKCILLKMV